MIQRLIAMTCLSLLLSVPLTGCKPPVEKHDDHAGHDHATEAGHEHEAEDAGVTYDPEKGMRLPQESREALGLLVEQVEERELQQPLRVHAQIYRSAAEASLPPGAERQGKAYATAFVAGEATSIRVGQPAGVLTPDKAGGQQGGFVWKVDSTQLAALGKSEVLFELSDDAHRFNVGDFVNIEIPVTARPHKVLTIPSAAVLQASDGVYAFVEKDDHLRRQAIRLGKRTDTFVEVLEGLTLEDRVAINSVEALYLIELRSTKGGGHSH